VQVLPRLNVFVFLRGFAFVDRSFDCVCCSSVTFLWIFVFFLFFNYLLELWMYIPWYPFEFVFELFFFTFLVLYYICHLKKMEVWGKYFAISQKKVWPIYYSVYQAWTTYCRPNISIKRRCPPKAKRRWLVVYDMKKILKNSFPPLTYLFYPQYSNFVLNKNFGTHFLKKNFPWKQIFPNLI
jgi:hypothetical protein